MYQPEIKRIGEELYFVAASPAARRLRTQAELLSQTDVPVLITGEAGSGKATVAQLIHSLSLRSSFPFIKVDCASLTADLLESELFGAQHIGANGKAEPTPGKFEQCIRGTVLLEDFDAMSALLQDRLLKLLQNREFVPYGDRKPVALDVRIIAAMDADVETALAETAANPELYHRLSVFQLHVPPLRERREEIPLLLGHFMNRLTRRYGVPAPRFTNALLDACQRHAWPGNLCELENFVKRFLALGDEKAALEELQCHASLEIYDRKGNGANGSEVAKINHNGSGEKSSLKELARNAKGEAERHAISQALDETHWNRKAAARLLHISYRGLLYKIQEYHLIAPTVSRAEYETLLKRNGTVMEK